jgi:hypothetical protein
MKREEGASKMSGSVDIELGATSNAVAEAESVSVEKEDEPLLEDSREEPLVGALPVLPLDNPEAARDQNVNVVVAAPVFAGALPYVTGDPARMVRFGQGNLRRVGAYAALAVLSAFAGLFCIWTFMRAIGAGMQALVSLVISACTLGFALYKLARLMRYPIGISMEASPVRDGVLVLEYYNKRRNEHYALSAVQSIQLTVQAGAVNFHTVIANFSIAGRANNARAVVGGVVGDPSRAAIAALPLVQSLLKVYNMAMLVDLTLEDLTSLMASAGQV